MQVIKVTLHTLRLNGNSRTEITTLGHYMRKERAEREAKKAIEENYLKYGSKEKPIVDNNGREDYLITNKAVYTKIEVKE